MALCGGAVLIAVTCATTVVAAAAQGPLTIENTVIVSAKAVRQATPQSNLELTMASDEHIFVPAADIYEKATQRLREVAAQQKPPNQKQAIDHNLLFVLRVRQQVPNRLSAAST